jgi:hypothetical protein
LEFAASCGLRKWLACVLLIEWQRVRLREEIEEMNVFVKKANS